jgi:hypothetical protein
MYDHNAITDTPNAYYNKEESQDINYWGKQGYSKIEIKRRLNTKRKEYFSYNYRFGTIIGEMENDPMEYKISFLNSKINGKPQHIFIQNNNIKRFRDMIIRFKLKEYWRNLTT